MYMNIHKNNKHSEHSQTLRLANSQGHTAKVHNFKLCINPQMSHTTMMEGRATCLNARLQEHNTAQKLIEMQLMHVQVTSWQSGHFPLLQ